LVATFGRHKAARGLYKSLYHRTVSHVIIPKNLAEVGFLREAESAAGTVTDDFYPKVEVTST